MMLYKIMPSKKSVIVAVTAVLLTLLAPPITANAQTAGTTLPPCKPGQTQTGGVVTCTGGGGGGGTGGQPPVDHSWAPTLPPPGDGRCIDRFGNPSYLSPLYQATTGTLMSNPEPCVAQDPTGPTSGTFKTRAVANVKVPDPTANFQGNFLTGAEVTFTAGDISGVRVPVPEIPGAYLQATPVKSVWDFGDNTPKMTVTAAKESSTAGPMVAKHTYQTVSPNPDKPGDHTVVVTVTGTWHLLFHQPTADPTTAVEDLGNIDITGTLQTVPATAPPAKPSRTIVQVWSAQTEPNS